MSADTSQKYAQCFEYACKLAEQADRLGVEHGIAERPPLGVLELSMMESQMRDVITKLSRLTGIHANHADFLFLVENYRASRITYFR